MAGLSTLVVSRAFPAVAQLFTPRHGALDSDTRILSLMFSWVLVQSRMYEDLQYHMGVTVLLVSATAEQEEAASDT